MRRGMRGFLSGLCLVFGVAAAFAQSADDEIVAAFTKLGQVKTYRIRTTLTPGAQYAQQLEMAKQMGFDMAAKPMEQEVINPDTRRITMLIPVMGGMPNLANLGDMKKMAKHLGPMAGGMPVMSQQLGLNRWECRGGAEKPGAATRPGFLHVKAAGTAQVGGEEAKAYQFSALDESTHQELPMTLYVSASSGLPLKIEMSRPEASLSMEFYDVNAPLDIPVPDCLKR